MKQPKIPAIANACFVSTLALLLWAGPAYCNASKNSKESTLKKVENAVSRENIKSKFHELTDSISKEKVHESIDQLADYLDKEKLKEGVDEIADYLDRDKIKDFIDYIADHLDRDKIKEMIDIVADALDREKIKGAVDQIATAVDKEAIQRSFDQSVDQIADSLQQAISSLEQEVQRLGTNKTAIQNLVERYSFKQWLPEKAVYGPVTLTDFRLSDSKKNITIARPGQKIDGEVICSLNRQQVSALGLYRVVLGIKNKGGQTTIFNHFGLRAGKEKDQFTLTAPREKGIYQVGFRVVEAVREGTALNSWDNPNDEWGEPVMVGLIIVV